MPRLRMLGDDQDLRRGKEMVRAGGSASRTINNIDTPVPGGGHHPAWKRPKDDAHGPRWTPDTHGFPVLGSLTPAEKNRRDRARLVKAGKSEIKHYLCKVIFPLN